MNVIESPRGVIIDLDKSEYSIVNKPTVVELVPLSSSTSKEQSQRAHSSRPLKNALLRFALAFSAVAPALGFGINATPAHADDAIATLISNLDRIYGTGVIEGTVVRGERWVATPGTPIGTVREDFTNGFADWDPCGATDFVYQINPSQPVTYRVVGLTQPVEAIQPYSGNISHEPAFPSPDEPIPANGGACPYFPGYPAPYPAPPGVPLPPNYQPYPVPPYYPTPVPGVPYPYNPYMPSNGITNVNTANGGSSTVNVTQ